MEENESVLIGYILDTRVDRWKDGWILDWEFWEMDCEGNYGSDAGLLETTTTTSRVRWIAPDGDYGSINRGNGKWEWEKRK